MYIVRNIFISISAGYSQKIFDTEKKEALAFEVKKFNHGKKKRLNYRLFHAAFRIIHGNKPSISR